jgi:hypothetical protein
VVRGVISGNVIRGCGRNGIHIEANSTDISVTGNSVYSCNHGGIEIQGEQGKTCSAIVISNNIVSNCCLSPSANLGNGAIDIGASTGGAYTGYGASSISVTGNILDGNIGCGIYAFQVSYSIISNNIIKNTSGNSTDTAHAVRNTAIYAISCGGTSIIFNQIFDSQGAGATTYYPIYYYGSAALIDFGNNFAGTLSGPQDLTASGVSKWFSSNLGNIRFDGGGSKIGFYGAVPVVKPSVTGSRGGNAALASMLTSLASEGLLTDSSTA